MTKTTESVLFLFSPPMQACYSLSSAPTQINTLNRGSNLTAVDFDDKKQPITNFVITDVF